MYSVVKKKTKIKGKISDGKSIKSLTGFKMASKNKVFNILNCKIKNIKIMNKDMASILVSEKVKKIYNKLIIYLTNLFIEDDDTGDNYREALNQIEKFRLEIKNKYREYLKKNELSKMSKQLVILQKEATNRLLEIEYFYKTYETERNNNRRR